MYFPYLRCKQFELLALREIAVAIGGENAISPILEPVKQSTNSFEKTLELILSNGINFSIIINPTYGDFVNNGSGIVNMINSKLAQYKNFQIAVIITESTDLDYVSSHLGLINNRRPLVLIHHGRFHNIASLAEWAADQEIKFNFHPENLPVRRYRGVIKSDSKVILEDKFRPQLKNADYLKVQDEFFSDDHLYHKEDGFVGFGDYVTIGNDYAESGWLPYAIAIHFTYKKANGEVWIRHFVSDSNTDTADVAGKFGEALRKLVAFIDEQNIRTGAANEFRELHADQHYPGLGSIKKLSIKNHLELIQSLLG